ncbi:succinate dehydrogenase/fumarate reductase flavoprotein subunit [Plasticicumulans lactativorans]|uniref:Succinate dehydrogenase/fumarate reductase flavoprotein subunit n=1 Tax=Plasticicumulans lactativorans TaxID=1133106 RepID=A0A4R2L3Q9_9GAMM|nr:FAD-dependent oxidoreductase [Plasticicumulans lactativorans]TCO81167.1 succinate dehydrogenase/fumarate reductase flavoprotein subunit [Plasticicumulans lactativorans]
MTSAAIECDVLVIGSGAGGMAAAITARHHGLDVLVIEKAPVFGGTTAVSGGWSWIPGNPVARRAGVQDDVDAAREYLRHELGEHFDAELVEAFLSNGPRMVAFFERETSIAFVPGTATPDFHPQSAGCGIGRPLCAAPFDGRALGADLARLRRPLPEMTFLGMGLSAGADLQHFFKVTRSLRSALYVAGRLARHLLDVLRHGRNRHLVNGNALAARLLKSANDLGVRTLLATPARQLLIEDGVVRGAIVAGADGERRITARRGVVLACGGFPHDIERRRQLYPQTPSGREHWTAAPVDNTGDGLRLGEAAGARVDTRVGQPAAWAPVSEVRRGDGTRGVFPHLIDRAKPGIIAVNAGGRRFVNEGESYHDFGAAMFRATAPGAEVAAWLICDHRTLRKYGMGYAKPFPVPLAPYLRSGYLLRGATLEGLAARAGIDPAGLATTVAEYNHHAREGRDPAFGKGSTAYNRIMADPEHTPNPCLAPLERGPFYAVKLLPGSLGTFAGLKTDAAARVLGDGGTPIAGLYAVGNDMASVMAGHYPSGGITLGPALTFGYIAGRHLAGVTEPAPIPSVTGRAAIPEAAL